MGTKEAIDKCRDLAEQIREIGLPSGLLGNIARGPAGIFSAWPDGMPRNMYDPETALLQREDVNDAIDRMEELCCQLCELAEETGIALEDIA